MDFLINSESSMYQTEVTNIISNYYIGKIFSVFGFSFIINIHCCMEVTDGQGPSYEELIVLQAKGEY
jgi:hypothetical protein